MEVLTMVANNRDNEMGRVIVDVEITNEVDRLNQISGVPTPAGVRSVKLNALVDTGATMLMIPIEEIKRLGLSEVRKSRSRIADGRIVERSIYGPARLRVLDREVLVEVAGGSAGIPPLLGQIPLES